MQVFEAFTAEQVDKILAIISKLEFLDGKETAKGYAKEIKSNRQISPLNPEASPVFREVVSYIKNSPSIYRYAAPRSVVGLRVASYREGDHYDWHVDFAHMGGRRADLSFTLFLSDKEEYEGGDLELDYEIYKTSFRGGKGQIVVYPTGTLHRVTEITKGERLCVVGWINSLIPDTENREALFKFSKELLRLKNLYNEPEELVQLNRLFQHFTRKLSD